MVDEALLDEAVALLGAKTYSKAVEVALREVVRGAKVRRILDLAGSGLWEGDLGTMRGDGRRERRAARPRR